MSDLPTSTESGEHAITTTLDPQRGGWLASCSCGWQAKRPHWYKRDTKLEAREHMEESG